MMECILNQIIDRDFDRLVADTQDLIRIPSVLDECGQTKEAPFGRAIAQALELALAKAAEMGFETKNVDGYAGYAELGSGGEQVAILAHLDVVPAVGEWIVPPYSAEIQDGKLYGRGSVDDKGPGMACLYAMKAIKESGLPISKRARLIWGTDEETFARGIHYYLEREENPAYGFSPDAEFPIIHAEKGTIRFLYHLPPADKNIRKLDAGTRLNVVPDYAAACLSDVSVSEVKEAIKKATSDINAVYTCQPDGILLEVKGLASHACYPEEGINAIQGLILILDELFPEKDSPLKKTIHSFANALAMETDGKTFGIACTDDISGALTMNTAILHVDGENKGVIKFDIRYPVTHDGCALLKKLEACGQALGGCFELIQHKPPLYVEEGRPFIAMLKKAYEESTGETARCISIGGGTYCRYIKNTVSFGPVFPGQKELAHQRNEFIALEDLRKIAKIYAQAIYNLIR